ncbi:MAG: glycosyltransferase family 2 protein [bacterium]
MKALILIRLAGIFLGLGIAFWGFGRFRSHRIRRAEFMVLFLFGTALFTVGLYPNSISILVSMMALQGEAYGRLIALLIVSNMILWVWFLFHRISSASRDRQFDGLVRKIASGTLDSSGERGIRPITVIIPALNEAQSLREVLPRLPRQVCGVDVGALVVDDGSCDGTADVAKEIGFAVVRNPINRGGGAALRLGYDVALQGRCRIVVTMDADGQHRPEEVESLVRPIIEDRLDFVIGSRVLGARERDSAVRLVGVLLFSRLINFLAGTRISDCSSCYRAFRVEAIRELRLVQDQYYAAEAIIDAAKKGLRIGEVPITILRRKYGESKKGTNWWYGLRFVRTIVKTWWR